MNGPLPIGWSLNLVFVAAPASGGTGLKTGCAVFRSNSQSGAVRAIFRVVPVAVTPVKSTLVGSVAVLACSCVEALDVGHVVRDVGGRGAHRGARHVPLDRLGVDRLAVGELLARLEVEGPVRAVGVRAVALRQQLLDLAVDVDGDQGVEEVLGDEDALGLLGVVRVDRRRLDDGEPEVPPGLPTRVSMGVSASFARLTGPCCRRRLAATAAGAAALLPQAATAITLATATAIAGFFPRSILILPFARTRPPSLRAGSSEIPEDTHNAAQQCGKLNTVSGLLCTGAPEML